jgi:S1-C subfamily serine protease
VLVTSVPKGGPADKQGAKAGDVITQVDGVEGITADEYCARFATTTAHATVTTAPGATYDASPIEGFWASMD